MPTIRTDGVEMQYERHGRGYPIIFVHGSGWDRRQWSPQIGTLIDQYQIITYDIRFHGESTVLEGGYDIHPNTLVDDLQALISALDLDEDPVVIGLSMGGAIAHTHAERYPDETAGLITYEAPATVGNINSVPLKILAHLYFGAYRHFGADRLFTLNQLVWKTLADGDEQQNDVTVRGLGLTREEYEKDAMSQADFRGLKQVMDAGIAPEDLSNISVPTLAVVSENAASSHEKAATTLTDGIPDAERITLEDADHAGNITNVSGFNTLLEEFMESKVLPGT